MTWYRTTNQDIILLSENLDYFQTFHFHSVITHTTGHTNTFHNTARIRRVTERTRSPLTVVLTVRLLPDTMKTMTFYLQRKCQVL